MFTNTNKYGHLVVITNTTIPLTSLPNWPQSNHSVGQNELNQIIYNLCLIVVNGGWSGPARQLIGWIAVYRSTINKLVLIALSRYVVIIANYTSTLSAERLQKLCYYKFIYNFTVITQYIKLPRPTACAFEYRIV